MGYRLVRRLVSEWVPTTARSSFQGSPLSSLPTHKPRLVDCLQGGIEPPLLLEFPVSPILIRHCKFSMGNATSVYTS